MPAHRGQRLHTRSRRAAGIQVLHYGVLVIIAGIVLFPIYITVVNSFLTPQAIGQRPPTLFPTHPHGSGYVTAFREGHLGIYLRNSVLVSVAITVGQVATS